MVCPETIFRDVLSNIIGNRETPNATYRFGRKFWLKIFYVLE
jgi:hypothetical protein